MDPGKIFLLTCEFNKIRCNSFSGEKLEITLTSDAIEIQTKNYYVVRYALLPKNTELFELHCLEQCCSSTNKNSALQTIKIEQRTLIEMLTIEENRLADVGVPCQ